MGVGGAWKTDAGSAGVGPAFSRLNGVGQARPGASVDPFTATGPLGLAAADYVWLCDEASGSLTDEVGGELLGPSGAVEYQQTADGLYAGHVAVESTTGAGIFIHASTSFLDFDALTSGLVMTVARTLETPSTARNIVRKGSTWGMRFDASTGAVTGIGTSPVLQVALDHTNNGWHYLALKFDRTGGNSYLFTDLGSDSVADTADHSGATQFSIFSASSGLNAQIAYVAVWVGAAAEGITKVDLDAWWALAAP